MKHMKLLINYFKSYLHFYPANKKFFIYKFKINKKMIIVNNLFFFNKIH